MRSSGVDVRAKASSAARSLRLVHVVCGLCRADDPEPVAVGDDFERRSSDETFLMVRCRACGLLYLNPRPAGAHAGQNAVASAPAAGLRAQANVAARVRRRLAARRLLHSCRGLPARASVLDLGCGEGLERDPIALAAARARGLTIHRGTLDDAELAHSSYDLVLARRTLESSGDPSALVRQIRRVLRPGGLLIAETGNAGSAASHIFRDRYWGGYRFPQAWQLFTRGTIARLAASTGLGVRSVKTRVSPLAWIDSIRNALVDARAPDWAVERFSASSPASLVLFTVVDALAHCAGGGSLLDVTLQRPPL